MARIALSTAIAFALALLSVKVQRRGPEQVVFSNLCGPTTSDLCYKPVLNGGFPYGFLFDRAGVSREDQLAFVEDRFRIVPFVVDVGIYALAIASIDFLARRWRRRAPIPPQ